MVSTEGAQQKKSKNDATVMKRPTRWQLMQPSIGPMASAAMSGAVGNRRRRRNGGGPNEIVYIRVLQFVILSKFTSLTHADVSSGAFHWIRTQKTRRSSQLLASLAVVVCCIYYSSASPVKQGDRLERWPPSMSSRWPFAYAVNWSDTSTKWLGRKALVAAAIRSDPRRLLSFRCRSPSAVLT